MKTKSLKKFKPVYKTGGAFKPNAALTGGTEAAAAITTPLVDMFDKGNSHGRQTGLSSGLKMGSQFAAAGATLGPVGAIAGGAIGLGAGLISSISAKQKEQAMDRYSLGEDQRLSTEAGMSKIAADPSLLYGDRNNQMFRDGGKLPGRKPVITNNPNDPRLKAYKDSLRLYTSGKKESDDYNKQDVAEKLKQYNNLMASPHLSKADKAELFKPSINNYYKYDQSSPGTQKGKVLRDGLKRKLIKNPDGTGLTKDENGYSTWISDKNLVKNWTNPIKPVAFFGTEGGIGTAIYKKPTQPVVYKAPKPVVKTEAVPEKKIEAVTPVPKPEPVIPAKVIPQGSTDHKGNLSGQRYQGTPATTKLIEEREQLLRSQSKRFATGGALQQNFNQTNDQLTPLNHQAVEVQGPSHEQGGVQIPGAEVEGGETISKGFVFSEELGFSKLHKPIAKAMGKLEAKPITAIRKRTMQALEQREQELATAQETFKSQLGIQ